MIKHIYENKKPVFSLEIFPPKKETNLDSIYDTVGKLVDLDPDFISVTYGAAGGTKGSITSDIAGKIKKDYGIEAVAHMTCINSSRKEVRHMIEEMKEKDIENVLVLRGDIVPEIEGERDFRHANELAIEIQKIGGMEMLGACYPEGHYESDSLDADIQNLKYKIGAGVEALITQLFFDNRSFYRYVDKVRGAGIDVPISAGVMPITKSSQIKRTVELSSASMPEEFTKMIAKYENDPDGLFEAGVEYAVKQIRDLIKHGVDGIHLYTMNTPEVADAVYDGISDLLQ
jgi:5,10-methylenetetrahydrofolate reductase, prokaryotic form